MKTVWCEAGERRVSESFDECEGCDECEFDGCMYIEEHEDFFKQQAKAGESLQGLMSSDAIKKAHGVLKDTFGVGEDEINDALSSFVGSLQHQVIKSMQISLKHLVINQASKFIRQEFDQELKNMFQSAIKEELLQITGDEAYETSIRKQCTKQITTFFAKEYESRDRRGKLAEESISKVIKKVTEDKVETALEEIKTEAVDKYNGEMVKTMMKSMGVSIQANPKLMAIITDKA